MAGLNLGNLLGAVTQATTALSDAKGLKAFLSTASKFGIQVKNNFEVNFSGIEDATFFIQTIDIPGMHQNYTTLMYDGRQVDVPINHEFDHAFSMTVLNDAQGYIYAAITNFIATDATNRLANSGYTMTVKALTGDKGGLGDKWEGSLVTMRGVRLENVSGLSFGYDDNSLQTFTVSGKLIDFTVTPGAAAPVAGWAGAANSLLGSASGGLF